LSSQELLRALPGQILAVQLAMSEAAVEGCRQDDWPERGGPGCASDRELGGQRNSFERQETAAEDQDAIDRARQQRLDVLVGG